jgi:hypothetical protein
MINFRLTAAALVLAFPAAAQDTATGDEIKAAVAGNTVAGSMLESGAYGEFYQADGAIKAADYSGSWTIEDDTMCFVYGSDPKYCFNVQLNGDQLTWIGDGAATGTGTILPGNPNNW